MSRLARQIKSMVHCATSASSVVLDEGRRDGVSEIAGPDLAPDAGQALQWSAVANLAVEVWRLARRLQRLPDHDAPQYQPVRNSVERLTIALGELAVTVDDPQGTDYDPRSSLEVVHVDLAPGVDPESASLVVTETVSPVVRREGHVIRHGRVIVGGRPASPEKTASSEEVPSAVAKDCDGTSNIARGEPS